MPHPGATPRCQPRDFVPALFAHPFRAAGHGRGAEPLPLFLSPRDAADL